jgi:hypothetical protein
MSDPNDPLLDSLKGLPPMRPDDLHAERVRRRAQSALEGERKLLARPWLKPISRAWSQAIVPSFCVAATAIYLVWALDFSSKLYGP